MKIGFDLLSIKVGKVGGLESYVCNLLKGFVIKKYQDVTMVLFCTRDNKNLFLQYENQKNVFIRVVNISSESVLSRIFYDLFSISIAAKMEKIDIMFSPIYSKPLFNTNIPWVTVIHDLQPLHFPEYFSFIKRLWLKIGWLHALNTSQVVTDSNFTKNDIEQKLMNGQQSRVVVISIPIDNEFESLPFELCSDKYNIGQNSYYYTISSMERHKNLITLLKAIKCLKDRGVCDKKLVITGVGNSSALRSEIGCLGIEDLVVITGYISNEERNALYKNCYMFLFPSTFEGFGMPTIEALKLGKKTVVSDIEVIKEVTQGRAAYVADYLSHEMWIDMIAAAEQRNNPLVVNFDEYSMDFVTEQYYALFKVVSQGGICPSPQIV